MAAADHISAQALPANVEAERSILGAILLDNLSYNQAAEHLKPEDFLLDSHRRIYARMIDLAESSRAIDQITLAEELERKGDFEAVGGYAYLAGLLDGVPDRPSIENYIKIVRDKALLRGLIYTATAAIASASEQSDPAEDILNDTEAQIFQLSEKRIGRGFMGVEEIIKESFGSIDALLERGRRITGLETHYADLDEITSGLQKSDLIIIAARPSMGKTSFAMNIAENAAIEDGKTVAVFSLEMSKEALLQRMLCSVARVDSHKFRTGSLWQEDMRKIAAAVEKLGLAPIFIDDSPAITVSEMRAKARRLLQSEGALDLVVVDYLQLMSGGGKRFENRTQEVSAISRGLKALAKELAVPVVALSQLSRAPESRGAGDHRPQLADLRESGCLTGETLIPIPCTGRRIPIRELVGRSGFRVWALNEQTWKLESAVASHAFSTGRKPVFELRTRLGRRIRATANHPFRTFSAWKPLAQLTAREYIALPRIEAGGSTQSMSHAELALLGHLIGHGGWLPQQVIQYTTREPDLAETVAALASEVFGDEICARVSGERNWFQVYLSSAPGHSALTHWLGGLGAFALRGRENCIPARVFEQPGEAIATFVRHLWASDGCIHLRKSGARRPPVLDYRTRSEVLARDLQSLLLRLEVNARLAQGKQGKDGDHFHVVITGAGDVYRAVNRIGVDQQRCQMPGLIPDPLAEHPANPNRDVIPHFIWSELAVPAMRRSGITPTLMCAGIHTAYCGPSLYRKNVGRERARRLGEALGSNQISALANSDVYWDSITSIAPAGTEEVFDLTVPGAHNFLANDFIVHNSIEQDADVVAFIFREEVYKPDDPELDGVAEIILRKQRNGPTGTVKMAFLKSSTRFESLAGDGPL